VPVSVEQESHAFVFGCAAPDLFMFPEADRSRYEARLDGLFNRVVLAEGSEAEEQDVSRFSVAELVPLRELTRRLDSAAGGKKLEVHLRGEAAGMSTTAPSGDEEHEIGRRVAGLYTVCFAHSAVTAIIWDGLADGELGTRFGGLLRRDLSPKYAYRVLQKLIGVEWHSRAGGLTDADGSFHFRGYYGDYRIVFGVGGANPVVETLALRWE
jgi:hypothetical protein